MEKLHRSPMFHSELKELSQVKSLNKTKCVMVQRPNQVNLQKNLSVTQKDEENRKR
jgi:hypothetical protein